jgi:hypothetical protein
MKKAEAEVVKESKAEAGAKISSRGISCDTGRGRGCEKEAETKAGTSSDMFYSQLENF